MTVLDIACGSGDVAIQIAKRARSAGLLLQVEGCDISTVAIQVARELAAREGLTDVTRFFCHDVVHDELPPYDVVMCLLFLHHLDDTGARRLLTRMKHAARQLVLIDDLCRTRLGYLLAWWGSRLLTRSPVVHIDGPRSVRAAYRPQEALALAESCGMTGATIRRHWPQRFLLEWRPPA